MRMKILCDIDGVLADCTHRLHFIQGEKQDWDGFFNACDDDKPIEEVCLFVRQLSLHFDIVFITGRPERIRGKTVAWFRKNDLPTPTFWLLMRADGDHRQDHEVKRELVMQNIQYADILAVIEDRDQVVEMWRKMGLLCLQPKKGDY